MAEGSFSRAVAKNQREERADFEQDRRIFRSGIEENSGDEDTTLAERGHGDVAILRNESREADAENDSIGIRNDDGAIEIVSMGVRNQIFAEQRSG